MCGAVLTLELSDITLGLTGTAFNDGIESALEEIPVFVHFSLLGSQV